MTGVQDRKSVELRAGSAPPAFPPSGTFKSKRNSAVYRGAGRQASAALPLRCGDTVTPQQHSFQKPIFSPDKVRLPNMEQNLEMKISTNFLL